MTDQQRIDERVRMNRAFSSMISNTPPKKGESRMTFTAVEHNPKYLGLTGEYDDPKREAYQYAARLQSQGRRTGMTFHTDGAVSVESAGLETMTFAPASS